MPLENLLSFIMHILSHIVTMFVKSYVKFDRISHKTTIVKFVNQFTNCKIILNYL